LYFFLDAINGNCARMKIKAYVDYKIYYIYAHKSKRH
jgi:hypothetical protein